jgi:hypothetical protein
VLVKKFNDCGGHALTIKFLMIVPGVGENFCKLDIYVGLLLSILLGKEVQSICGMAMSI